MMVIMVLLLTAVRGKMDLSQTESFGEEAGVALSGIADQRIAASPSACGLTEE